MDRDLAPVSLAAHGWDLELLPHLGGAFTALRFQGHDVLRPAPAAPEDVLDASCFPLVPYANRIAWGGHSFAGQRFRLPSNFGDHPHSLHGFGWQSAWQISQVGGSAVVLVHHHEGDSGWPWLYRALQRVELEPNTARIMLGLTNTGSTPMPAGLGIHPYFPVDRATRLRFAAARVWLADDTQLPLEPALPGRVQDWSMGAPAIGPVLIDNAYEGWDGTASLTSAGARLGIAVEGADILHVFRPPDSGFICLEPVTHLPDAINRGGMNVVAPGQKLSLTMTITVTPPESVSS